MRLASLLLTLSFLGAGNTPPPSESVLRVIPHTVVAVPFFLENKADTPLRGRWEIKAPLGWLSLGSLTGELTILQAESSWVTPLFSVPADSPPGPVEVSLRWEEEGGGTYVRVRHLVVVSSGRIGFRPSSGGEPAFSGIPFRTKRWLENRSNLTVEGVVSGHSSRDWRVEVSPSSFNLLPGEGVWITALVHPPSLLATETQHTLRLVATTTLLPLERGATETRITTPVLPNASGAERLRGRVEIESTVQGQGAGTGGINLALEGTISPHRTGHLRLGEAIAFGGQGTFSRRETTLGINDDRWGGLLVGRTGQGFTRLSATGQWGDWAKIHFDTQRGRLSFFSSLSDPKETLLGRTSGLSYSGGRGELFRYGLVAFHSERGTNNPNSAVQVASVWGKGRSGSLSWESEVALGRESDGGEMEPALRGSLRGTEGRWSYGVELEGASAGFQGTIRNRALGWGFLGFRASESWQVWVQSRRERSPRVDLAGGRDALGHTVGVTWSAIKNITFTLSRSRTHFGETSLQPLSSVEKLWNGRVDWSLLGGLLATAEWGIGEKVEGGGTQRVIRPRFSMRYAPHPKWYLQVRVDPDPRGDESFVFKRDWSLLSRWQMSDESWFQVEGQALTCGGLADDICQERPQTRISLGRDLGGSLAEWRLTGYAITRGSGQEIVGGVQLARSLSLPSPFGSGGGLVGRLVSEEGELFEGVPISLGERTTLTDKQGAFSFEGVSPGDYDLDVDTKGLGLSWTINHPLPLSVRITPGDDLSIDVPVVRPGRINGRVLVVAGPPPQSTEFRRGVLQGTGNGNGHTNGYKNDIYEECSLGYVPSPGRTNGNASGAGANGVGGGNGWGCLVPVSGIALHFRHGAWEDLHFVVITNQEGMYEVGGLLPGIWRVTVHKGDIPVGKRLKWNGPEMVVEVAEGGVITLKDAHLVWFHKPESLELVEPINLTGTR
ncbi:carboxypeptidase regulatory-like domain-containing protein [bacterium]|nr:carboxypeptidase regulatory-like domain-containing protein [bacterium]